MNHGIQSLVISSNAIRSLLHQGSPSLLYAGHGHYILFVFRHWYSVSILWYSNLLFRYFLFLLTLIAFFHKLLVMKTIFL
jgi:hypothetical protein